MTTRFRFAVRPLWAGLLTMLCLLAAEAGATALFATEVEVLDDSPEVRQKALQKAFSQVLIKVSGQSSLKGRKGASRVIRRAADFVQQFRYRTEVDDQEQEQRWLWVQFDQRAVERALEQLGLAPWTTGRPDVLVWLAKDTDGQRSLLDQELDLELVRALRQAAAQRGMPLLLPLMDLEDRSALTVADVWAGNQQALQAASARYGQPLILVGRVRQQGDQWSAKWSLLLQDQEKQFSSQGNDVEAVIQAGIGQAMVRIADVYAPLALGDELEKVVVRFVGVMTLDDYARLMALLERLGDQFRVAVEQVDADHIIVSIAAPGGVDILRQRLSLEPDLQPAVSMPVQAGSLDGGQALTYQLY